MSLPVRIKQDERKARITIQLVPRRKQIIKEFPELEKKPVPAAVITLPPPEPTNDNSTKENIVSSELVTFQIIPHANIRNDKIQQFADCIADSYLEFFERMKLGRSTQDKVFFETEMTNKSYKTFITTTADASGLVKQQSQVVWKGVTHKGGLKLQCNDHSAIAYDFKLKYPNFLSLKTDKKLTVVPLAEILEMSQFMKDNDRVLIQFGFQSAEESWYSDALEDKKVFEKKPPKRWKKKEINEMKTALPGFDFVLRLVVECEDERRKRRIARGIILALKQLNHDNELTEKMVKPFKVKKWLNNFNERIIKVPVLIGKRQIITPPEIAHFIKLPQKALQEEYPIIETISTKETKIPERLMKGGIKLGAMEYRGESRNVYMPTEDWDELCLPCVVIGGMGQGKTAGYGANRVIEFVNAGFGGLAIDPKDGQIKAEFEVALPKEQIISIKFGDKPISLDWREAMHSPSARNRLANTVISFFNSSTDEAGAQTARYLRAAVMAMQTGKLAEILKILEDKEYRTECIQTLNNPMHIQTLQDMNEMSDGKRAQILAPIYNRLDTILGDEYLYSCMEADKGIDLVEITSQKKACVIDIPKGLLGKEGVEIIGNLIMTKLDLAMTLREEKNRFPYTIVIDEPHQFSKSASQWKSATVEARYWRYNYVFMFHTFIQIPSDLKEIIKAALPHYHLYPSDKKTFIDLAEEIRPFTVDDALKLKRFHSINCIRSKGEVNPFIALMTKPPSLAEKN